MDGCDVANDNVDATPSGSKSLDDFENKRDLDDLDDLDDLENRQKHDWIDEMESVDDGMETAVDSDDLNLNLADVTNKRLCI